MQSQRAEGTSSYLERGWAAVLQALDEVTAAHRTTPAAVALAWLQAQPRVVAPITSAHTTEQLELILPAAALRLSPADLDRLAASTSAVTSPR